MLEASGAVVDYLRIRMQLARDYPHASLLDLLNHGTEVEAVMGRRTPISVLLRSIRIAEKLAKGLGAPDTCLFRAIARFRLLRRARFPVAFCMGISPDDTAVGHAWVELDGSGVLEPIPTEFIETFRYPDAQRVAL